MSPSRAQRPRRGRRLTLTPVPRWFPGRGSAFVGPPVRIFYASRIRANLGWWKAQGAPRKIVAALSKGVKLEFSTTPQPFKLSPLLVADGDVDDPKAQAWMKTVSEGVAAAGGSRKPVALAAFRGRLEPPAEAAGKAAGKAVGRDAAGAAAEAVPHVASTPQTSPRGL